jgi:hypothetical protein
VNASLREPAHRLFPPTGCKCFEELMGIVGARDHRAHAYGAYLDKPLRSSSSTINLKLIPSTLANLTRSDVVAREATRARPLGDWRKRRHWKLHAHPRTLEGYQVHVHAMSGYCRPAEHMLYWRRANLTGVSGKTNTRWRLSNIETRHFEEAGRDLTIVLRLTLLAGTGAGPLLVRPGEGRRVGEAGEVGDRL